MLHEAQAKQCFMKLKHRPSGGLLQFYETAFVVCVVRVVGWWGVEGPVCILDETAFVS